MGVVNYFPTKTKIDVWRNGRKSKADRIVFQSTVFIYCTEERRKEIVALPFIFHFMTDKACPIKGSANKHLEVIPNNDIGSLKFILGQSDVPVEISEVPFKKGNNVRVIRGSLVGPVGKVIDTYNTKSELIVDLEFFCCARLLIDTINLEIIK